MPIVTDANTKEVTVTLSKDIIRKLLDKHDKNKDNRLSKYEIKNVFIELDSLFPGWRAWRAFKCADYDGNGYVDEHEKEKLVDYIYELGYIYK
ncbi:hypothetical protein NMG60_11032036 [Bertholletia excelsa]